VETRDRIVDAALRLFNEEGSGAVSTNHIASDLGISPGNLYYHFRNKEEIIRAIYARLRPAWEAASALPADHPPTIADLQRILGAHFGLVWVYRFYYRELPALLRRDPELAREYREIRRAALDNIQALLQSFITARVMRPPSDPAVLADLAEICWLLVDFWLPYSELGDNPPEPGDVARGVALVMRVLHPYFTEDVLAALANQDLVGIGPKGVFPWQTER
jgi:AcrR family transcriptional regulator